MKTVVLVAFAEVEVEVEMERGWGQGLGFAVVEGLGLAGDKGFEMGYHQNFVVEIVGIAAVVGTLKQTKHRDIDHISIILNT